MKSQISMGFKYVGFMGKSVKENASLGEDFVYRHYIIFNIMI